MEGESLLSSLTGIERKNIKFSENIFLIEDVANLSVLPTLATIDNDTYCFHYDLVAYVRCIETSSFDNSTPLENRWLADTIIFLLKVFSSISLPVEKGFSEISSTVWRYFIWWSNIITVITVISLQDNLR